MKTSRLLAYGIAGVIAGLLIENRSLIYKMKAKAGVRMLEKKIEKKLA